MLKRFDLRKLETGLISVFFLGFASGLPFLLILSTLSVWLAEIGVSKTMIGLFAWVSIPYALKFMWGPLVDKYRLPILYKYLGLRRSWILLAQIFLWITVVGLGNTDPLNNLMLTIIFAVLVGISSAIQDIAIEAYRIEILPPNKIGIGASTSVIGYRLGMLCSGAGTITLAALCGSWSIAYTCIAMCMVIGIITTLCSVEPKIQRTATQISIWRAIKFFAAKREWQIIIPFILSYKISDTILNVMNMPFLLEIGFNKLEIAYVAKTFGIGAMIFGGIVGGVMLMRQSLRQNLFTCVCLQAVASALFIVQAQSGNNLSLLFVSMGVENFVCGMSQVALIAYMTHLCSKQSTALHFAILSSFASFVRVGFSAVAGWLADRYGWPQFYAIVCVSCVPSILLLLFCVKHFALGTQVVELEPQNNLVKGEI